MDWVEVQEGVRGRLLREELGLTLAAVVSCVQVSIEGITFAVMWSAVINTRQVMSLDQNKAKL